MVLTERRKAGIIGTWQSVDEDCPTVLTVRGADLDHVQVRARDANDGERLRLSSLKVTTRTLGFRYWVPSTDYRGQYQFSLKSDGVFEGRWTSFDAWLRVPTETKWCSHGPKSTRPKSARTFTIASFIVHYDEKCKAFLGVWGPEDGSTMRLAVSIVRKKALRIRLFDVFFRGRRSAVTNVRMTTRTLHFEGLAPSSGDRAIFHLVIQKDGSLLNRRTLFETWLRKREDEGKRGQTKERG